MGSRWQDSAARCRSRWPSATRCRRRARPCSPPPRSSSSPPWCCRAAPPRTRSPTCASPPGMCLISPSLHTPPPPPHSLSFSLTLSVIILGVIKSLSSVSVAQNALRILTGYVPPHLSRRRRRCPTCASPPRTSTLQFPFFIMATWFNWMIINKIKYISEITIVYRFPNRKI